MTPQVQPAHTLVWPTLQALVALGGSGGLLEITEQVVEMQAIQEEVQAVPHGDSGRSELEYRLAWARTYLKNIGAAEASARGVWRVTDLGRTLNEPDTERLMREWRSSLALKRNQAQSLEELDGLPEQPTVDLVNEEIDVESQWDSVLLNRLLLMPPDAFERLSQRLLREAGFENVEVTGRSGDGGIDGFGIYRVFSMVSFPVFFQCKRYKGSVPPHAVRDFRGAMQGRGDKGLLVTTGTFTADARREAHRDGAPPIDLIDGARLCELLKEHGLGVVVEARTVEDIRVDLDFFDRL